MVDDPSQSSFVPSRSNPPGDESALPPRVVRSEDLLAGRREVLIQHGDALYRLRLTSQGRLILTK